MLDESPCGYVDARHSIDNGLCDLFNLRLSKCGSFHSFPASGPGRERAGLKLSTRLPDRRDGRARAAAGQAHFACSVADLRYVEGSYDRHLVKETLGKQDLTFGWGSAGHMLNSIGLGVGLDPQKLLARVSLRKEILLWLKKPQALDEPVRPTLHASPPATATAGTIAASRRPGAVIGRVVFIHGIQQPRHGWYTRSCDKLCDRRL